MKRDDFVFTIGYSGDTAIIDKAARRRHRGADAATLLEAGLLRAAFCAAMFDEELDQFVPRFREATGIEVQSADELKRLFGVFAVPEELSRVNAL